MLAQLQEIVAVLAGPVNDSVVGTWQLFSGTVIVTRSLPPGGSVPLDGLKVMFGTPLLEDFQLRLKLCELLLIEAKHIQTKNFWPKVHCFGA